ncbi:Uncharacterised protein [Vibrio cholerae]|nr:Uncharacterised protein [Vibrio cholerae]CSD10259.1 Uncharacterised protein [Vibrio cholerae]CSI78826.1 Uncharacterised protein [Vibrio cholerae]CSI81507.1 Uncharacterised protein [Vibrio cholerae]
MNTFALKRIHFVKYDNHWTAQFTQLQRHI